jgi:hypothetical protein
LENSLKIAGIENRHINGIGHDDADKILSEEAQKRLSDELSTIGASEYSKQEILKEYQKKIEE